MILIDKIKNFKYKRAIATGITALALGVAIYHDAYYTDLAREKWQEAKKSIDLILGYCKEKHPQCSYNNLITTQIEAEILGRQADLYTSKTLLIKYLAH